MTLPTLSTYATGRTNAQCVTVTLAESLRGLLLTAIAVDAQNKALDAERPAEQRSAGFAPELFAQCHAALRAVTDTPTPR